MTNEQMHTVKEVAKRLRVSHTTVIRLIETEEIKNVLRIGNQYRIPDSSLQDYLRRASQR
jgi:excisionase family DNA binding protein